MPNLKNHGSNSTHAFPSTQGAGCTGQPLNFKTGLVSLLELELGLQAKAKACLSCATLRVRIAHFKFQLSIKFNTPRPCFEPQPALASQSGSSLPVLDKVSAKWLTELHVLALCCLTQTFYTDCRIKAIPLFSILRSPSPASSSVWYAHVTVILVDLRD